jgi:hypothetical protein
MDLPDVRWDNSFSETQYRENTMPSEEVSEETMPELTWNKSLEEYFCNTSEQCMGYAWLHKRCEEMYSHRTIFIDLPTIIIGAVNGFVSVGSKQIFGEDAYAPVYIGGVSLFVSILSTVNSYFGWSRKAEAHKIACNSYSKLYRFIAVEMNTKPRTERMNPKKFLEYVRTTFDQLGESSPLIAPTIVNSFIHKFGTLKDFSLPEETNGLHAVYSFNQRDISPPNTPEHPLKIPSLMSKLGSPSSMISSAISSVARQKADSHENTVDHNHIAVKIIQESVD